MYLCKLYNKIHSYSQKVYSENRIRELAGTLKEILDLAGQGYINEKRRLFEDLCVRVLVSDKQLQAVELALTEVSKSERDTVSSVM